MTTPYMTSKFDTYSSYRRYDIAKIYQVEIEDEDGVYYDFEVTGDDYADAARNAENMAYSEGINISIMNIYEY